MYRVSLSKNYKRVRNPQKDFRALVGRIYDRLQQAVNEELSTKTYQNRTGRLAGGTMAKMIHFSGSGFSILIKQGMPYGKFVQARGYSEFDSIMVRARDSINRMVNRFVR